MKLCPGCNDHEDGYKTTRLASSELPRDQGLSTPWLAARGGEVTGDCMPLIRPGATRDNYIGKELLLGTLGGFNILSVCR